MPPKKKNKPKKNYDKTTYNNFEISHPQNIKSNNNINLNLNAKIKSENQKNAQKNVDNYDITRKRKRAKSCKKKLIVTFKNNFNFNLEDEFRMDEEESKFTEFYFDKYDLNKLNDNYEKFPSFSEISKKKELYFENNIKKLISVSSNLHNCECFYSKNENVKEIEINSLLNTNESFNSNLERLKIGVNNYIKNFEKIILLKYPFSFDYNYSKKLDPFVDNKDDINLDYFSKNNQIFTAYRNKNIRAINLCSDDDIISPVNEIKIDNDEDIFGSIDKIHQRWLNKKKLTKKMNEASTDNIKVSYEFKNSLEIPLIEQVFKEFVKQKIKTMEITNDISPRPIIDFSESEFVTEIYYSFKGDNTITKKLNLNSDIFIEDSIEQINQKYINKNIFNMNIKSEKLKKTEIDTLEDLNINIFYEKFKNWKKSKIKKKNDYIYSGKASVELTKSTLINNIYDNPKTSILHNLSLQLNEINSKNGNDNKNLNLTIMKSANFNYSNCAKKLKNEIDLSLSNKNTFNSKMVNLKKNKSEILGIKKKLSSINPRSDENDEKNKEYKNMIRKIKKEEDDINKKRKKIYVSKIKQQQDNNFEKEIKKETKYRMIYPIIILIIPLIYSVYRHYSSDFY